MTVVSDSEATLETPTLGLMGGAATLEFVNDDGVGVVSRSILQIIDAPATFAAHVRSFTNSSVFHLAVTDVDGDGRLDLVAPEPSSTIVRVLQSSPPNLTFIPGATWATSVAGEPFLPVVGDFNGDNRPDVVVTLRGRRQVAVLRNDRTRFDMTTVPITQIGVGAAVADVSGDGLADIVVGGLEIDSDILVGQGDGTFTNTPLRFSMAVGELATGRIGSDARLAVFGIATDSSSLQVARAAASPSTRVSIIPIPRLAYGPSQMADLDGRGTLDLVANSAEGTLVARGRSDDTFEGPTFLSTNVGYGRGFAVADFNGDTVLDVVAVSFTGDVTVFLNQGDAQFTQVGPLPMSAGAVSVAVGDLDGDGKVDIVLPRGGNSNIFVYRNTTPTPMP